MPSREPDTIVDKYLAKGGLNRGHLYLMILGALGGTYEHGSKSTEIAEVRSAVVDQKVAVAVLQTQQQQTNVVLAQIADDVKQLTRSMDRHLGDRPSSLAKVRPEPIAATP